MSKSSSRPALTKFVRYKSGATRSETPDYSKIPIEPLILLAERITLGAKIHGLWNWTRGMSVDVIVNHIIEHSLRLTHGIPDKHGAGPRQHIGAILFGGMALAYNLYHHPEYFQNLTIPERRGKK